MPAIGRLLAGAAFLWLSGSVAQAQQPAADCQTKPQSSQDSTATSQPTLGQKLDDCDGVLKPPNVGDGDIVEPAPQTGNMPVIEPHEVPPKANQNSNPK